MLTRAIPVLVLAFAISLTVDGAWAQGQPAQSTEILRETHGDWNIRCNSARPDECYMVQTASNDQGRPMVEFSLIRLAPGGPAPAGATAVVPLGTALPEGLLFQVDGGEPLRFAYDFCAPAGCIANLALTAEQVASMKRGVQALITIKAASRPETPIPVRISLRGFTAAYESL